MTRIAIIDDEFNVRELLKKLIDILYKDIEIVGEAASIMEAKKMLNATQPDIVLLDIELEDGTGFSLLDQLESIDFKLVFITAFNQYAIKAFKYNAIDYLLKPISPEEFKNTLDRVKDQVFKENEIQLLLTQLKEGENFEYKKIVINTVKEKHIINIEDILYCESEGAYTNIVTKTLTILASKNLKHFQELLPEFQFIRPHQSFLVNKKVVISIKDNTLLLTSKIEIPISSRKKAEIKNILLKKD
ncbi:LytR/AlgR family response regulator transcription factor [Lacinutrix mariniflava]|uniref:LytR/AlgR family response regulator transcription factor n=1 Tax=Lacinutrix mariniflava TaxID=342955 RepID=UPI0006E3322E|nr:LytTR family DNA-binding domain-containing protein [Lacinutrix mariniflava]